MQRCWFKTFISRRKTGLIFLSFGFFFFFVAFSFKAYQKSRQNILSFSQAPELLTEVSEELLPAQILIPNTGVDLAVFPARVEDDIWQISREGASYLSGSGIPGREGNVIIYGHNKNSLFGPIRWLEKEAKIKLLNKRGEEFIYKVVETKTVSPDLIEVLSSTEDPVLTLYTCTGFLDSQRYVVKAKLQPEAE